MHDQTIGSRAQVMNGTAHHTTGGLVKKDLKKNPKTGEIVSRAKSAGEKKNPWIVAVGKAKKELKIKKGEMVLVSKGTPLYEKAKELMK
jgi:co-chaperonin GroES (HSP10)